MLVAQILEKIYFTLSGLIFHMHMSPYHKTVFEFDYDRDLESCQVGHFCHCMIQLLVGCDN
jgi:hypothetical protein